MQLEQFRCVIREGFKVFLGEGFCELLLDQRFIGPVNVGCAAASWALCESHGGHRG
jgi:hypothetical protein